MLAARIGLAGAMERIDEDEPLVDVVLALTASTAAMLALLDVVAGRWPPLTVAPCLLILAARSFRMSRVGVLAATVVWLRMLGLSEATGVITPLLMLGLCAALLIGPGRVLDWFEAQWEAGVERRRLRLEATAAARSVDAGADAVGWIEDLPDPR